MLLITFTKPTLESILCLTTALHIISSLTQIKYFCNERRNSPIGRERWPNKREPNFAWWLSFTLPLRKLTLNVQRESPWILNGSVAYGTKCLILERCKTSVFNLLLSFCSKTFSLANCSKEIELCVRHLWRRGLSILNWMC